MIYTWLPYDKDIKIQIFFIIEIRQKRRRKPNCNDPKFYKLQYDTTLCDKVCQLLATGWWFSPGTLVSSTKAGLVYGV